MAVIIQIPVPRYVKKFYEHPTNFGPNMVVNQRSVVGSILTTVLSFDPVDKHDLPVKWRGKVFDGMDLLEVKVVMPLNIVALTPHHLRTLGETLEVMFEREFLGFCSGRFKHSPNWNAAVIAWRNRYELMEDDANWDSWKRWMLEKYKDSVNLMLDIENKARMEAAKQGVLY